MIADVHARYFGTELDDQSLTPCEHPRFGPTGFDDWLNRTSGSERSATLASTSLTLGQVDSPMIRQFSILRRRWQPLWSQ